jgi:TolB-like protein/tetratricopeptide (TPR) repeat protein
MSDVFVSYKAEDRARVEPLVQRLEAEGLSVWWDARVSGGEAWRETIAENLDLARCVIVIWSKRSTGPEGRFVRDEASRAQRRNVYLPVTIDKVEPPLGFGETQALPLTSWKGDAADPRYRAISACVHSMLGRDAPIAVAKSQSGVTRRAALAAGGGAGVIAAGAAGWMLFRPTAAKGNTIAVLPFANLSGDRSEDYFSDGMAEEVRAALAALGTFHVVARTSSEVLRNADAVTAAHRLDVANVVTGSVRRSDSTVRVNAQLVDGKDGLEQWSQSFDRPFGDVLQIQSDIAANVARALSARLGGGAPTVAAIGGTSDPQAQDLLLQATASVADDSNDGHLRRIAQLTKATQLDPNYAQAFARLAVENELWASTYARNSAEKDSAEATAIRAARRAIELAPNLALGHSALGVIYHNQLAMSRAFQESQRSVSLPGAESPIFFNHALTLSQIGRQSEAETMAAHAISLDPLNAVARAVQARILFYGRRYPESLEAGRRALLIKSENSLARSVIGWDLLLLNRLDEARQMFETLPADDYRRIVGVAAIAVRLKRKDEAVAALDAIHKRYGDAANYQIAQIYAQLGDLDKGGAALQAAWEKRDSGLASMRVDPFIDPLRKDPRYRAIATRVFG